MAKMVDSFGDMYFENAKSSVLRDSAAVLLEHLQTEYTVGKIREEVN